MDKIGVLVVFLVLRLIQQILERGLVRLNRRYYLDPARQGQAVAVLGITSEDMGRTLAYSEDKFRFGVVSGWLRLVLVLLFLALGGLGMVEASAARLSMAASGGAVVTGLFFFALLGALGMAMGLPFEWYRTFVIEQRHGFNRQTPRGFWLDRLKGVLLAVIIGAPLAALILWIMAAGAQWWLYAWIALTVFSLVTAWLYPALLAPLFNKFSPAQGELKDQVDALAAKVGFRSSGVYVMDASKRSSHGNAYFTGAFGKKRIVLFDTLVEAMSIREVVAVLAHELGHFKLHHVRWGLIRGTLMTGVMFYLLSVCLPLTPFYTAFGLMGVSNYGALVVFSLWFGLVDFLLSPLENFLSRRNEFAADRFARTAMGNATDLHSALLKLREKSHAMPLSHPWFSGVYHSHPPLLERLEALGKI